ncbi:hypothetical protein ABPG72_017295 [Tetrahymena utriculariae]
MPSQNTAFLECKSPLTAKEILNLEQVLVVESQFVVFFAQQLSASLQKGTVFQIGGILENEDFYYLKFSISKCVNNTSNNPHKAWNPVCESSHKVVATQNSISSYSDSAIFNVQQGSMYTTVSMYINSQTLITDESIFPVQMQILQIQCNTKPAKRGNNTPQFTVQATLEDLAKFSYQSMLFSCNLYLELANKLYDFDIPNQEKIKEITHKTSINRNSGAIDNAINSNNTNQNNHNNTLKYVSMAKELSKVNLRNISQEDKNNRQFPQKLQHFKLSKTIQSLFEAFTGAISGKQYHLNSYQQEVDTSSWR